MKSHAATTLERVLWTGAALLLVHGLATGGLHSLRLPQDTPMAAGARTAPAVPSGAPSADGAHARDAGRGTPDFSDWSAARAAAFLGAPGADPVPPAGRLSIPGLDIDVPLYEGTSGQALDRGVGLIEGTSAPGTGANVNTGIAGHRDGWFRRLGDIAAGDAIELRTTDGVFRYEVYATQVVPPDAVHVLEPGDEVRLTLVTCWPFYFLGPAPKRFVVQARLAT